ncbi:MAG: flagellar export chaperone FliS [Syntrophus sp. (in: bacteria)]
MYEAATKSYRETNFLSADPLKLIRICYEGAIGSLKLARDAYIARDYEAKGKALVKTLDIIHELNASLDMEKGGDVAKNLRALYLYMSQALIDADLKKDLKGFDAMIHMLEELESAWQELALGQPESVSTSPSAVLPYEAKKMDMVSRMAWSA